jgi:hypothetical protein
VEWAERDRKHRRGPVVHVAGQMPVVIPGRDVAVRISVRVEDIPVEPEVVVAPVAAIVVVTRAPAPVHDADVVLAAHLAAQAAPEDIHRGSVDGGARTAAIATVGVAHRTAVSVASAPADKAVSGTTLVGANVVIDPSRGIVRVPTSGTAALVRGLRTPIVVPAGIPIPGTALAGAGPRSQ